MKKIEKFCQQHRYFYGMNSAKNKIYIETDKIILMFNAKEYFEMQELYKIIIINKKTQEKFNINNICPNIKFNDFSDLINQVSKIIQIKQKKERNTNRKNFEEKLKETFTILEKLCTKYDYKYHNEVENFIIITNYSRWKFNIIEYINNNIIELFHENSQKHNNYKKDIYHNQNKTFKTLEELFNYINFHDIIFLNSDRYYKTKRR